MENHVQASPGLVDTESLEDAVMEGFILTLRVFLVFTRSFLVSLKPRFAYVVPTLFPPALSIPLTAITHYAPCRLGQQGGNTEQ